MDGGASVWLPALIAGGAGIGSAAIASKGAKSAAQTAADSASQAAQLQKDIYTQTRADLAPQRELGAQAATTLGALMGLGGGSGSAGGGSASLPTTGAPVTSSLSDAVGAGWPPARLNPYTGQLQTEPGPRPAGQNAYDVRMRPDGSGYVNATAGAKWYPGPGQAQGDLVTMQAPDGTQQAVPADQVAHYQAKGAQVVRS
jgi:hypothetical protein